MRGSEPDLVAFDDGRGPALARDGSTPLDVFGLTPFGGEVSVRMPLTGGAAPLFPVGVGGESEDEGQEYIFHFLTVKSERVQRFASLSTLCLYGEFKITSLCCGVYEGFLWAHSGNAKATTDELHVIMGGLIREPSNIAREN